jgi:hypothetical protein
MRSSGSGFDVPLDGIFGRAPPAKLLITSLSGSELEATLMFDDCWAVGHYPSY